MGILPLNGKCQTFPAEILHNDITCEIDQGFHDMHLERKFLIKINSPHGREHAEFYLQYNENEKINKLTVKLIDKNKRLIRVLKKKEIEDNSLISGYFHTDDRYKEFKAIHNSYPYYIEVSYSQKFAEFFSLPTWYPQMKKNIPAKNSRYTLKVPETYNFKFKHYNFTPGEKITSERGNNQHYTWEVNDLMPLNLYENYIPPAISLYPHSVFVPNAYIFGGIRGSMDQWKNFGNWNSKLISDLDMLPPDENDKISALTANCANEHEKVKVLYEYLQNTTRYVGVFVGMGGWKPFSANYVCEKKYGDCKGLVNYMKAMLKAVEIPSYYALIRAGANRPDIDTSFVSNQFNHVVLFVPLKNDTLWLECTSQRIPFGYWGTFTQGKHALVCNGPESFLVKSPSLSHNENFQHRKIIASFEDMDDLNVSVSRNVAGVFGEIVAKNIYGESNRKIKELSHQYLPFKNFTVNEISYGNSDSITNEFEEYSNITIGNHVQAFNNNLIIENIISFKDIKPLKAGGKRINPVYLQYNKEYIDTVIYKIPEGYKLSYMPEEVFYRNKFGLIDYAVDAFEDEIVVKCRIMLNNITCPTEDYNNFAALIDKIKLCENHKFLLER